MVDLLLVVPLGPLSLEVQLGHLLLVDRLERHDQLVQLLVLELLIVWVALLVDL